MSEMTERLLLRMPPVTTCVTSNCVVMFGMESDGICLGFDKMTTIGNTTSRRIHLLKFNMLVLIQVRSAIVSFGALFCELIPRVLLVSSGGKFHISILDFILGFFLISAFLIDTALCE